MEYQEIPYETGSAFYLSPQLRHHDTFARIEIPDLHRFPGRTLRHTCGKRAAVMEGKTEKRGFVKIDSPSDHIGYQAPIEKGTLGKNSCS